MDDPSRTHTFLSSDKDTRLQQGKWRITIEEEGESVEYVVSGDGVIEIDGPTGATVHIVKAKTNHNLLSTPHHDSRPMEKEIESRPKDSVDRAFSAPPSKNKLRTAQASVGHNRPGNGTLIHREDFRNRQLSNFFSFESNELDAPIVDRPRNPISVDSLALVYQYRQGTDESEHRLSRKAPFQERYLRWKESYVSPFVFPHSQQLAIVRSQENGQGPKLLFELQTSARGLQTLAVQLSDQQRMLFQIDKRQIGPLALNVWHEFAIYIRNSSSPDVIDGRVAAWHNGALIVDSGSIATHSTRPLEELVVGGGNSWSTGLGPGRHRQVPQNQARFIADIEVHSSLPVDVELP